jgi:CHAT domain-containing protein
MKFFIPILLSLFLFSCVDDDDSDLLNTDPVPSTPAKPAVSRTDEACALCEMDIKIIETQNLVSALYHNKNRQAEMLQLKHDLDSMNQLYSQLVAKFNNDVVKVQNECAAKYNLNTITDTAKRNALFAAYFVWYHNATFPAFDTVGYVPVIKNGMYEVQHKGKTYLWTKQQHANYVKNGVSTETKTKAMFDKALKTIASQLTGLEVEKIDKVCMNVLGSLSLAYQTHPYTTQFKNTDKDYIEYIKIQQATWE